LVLTVFVKKWIGDAMTKIEVYERGLSFSLTEITPELAKELTETGIHKDGYSSNEA
jgi:hypothetical protein